MVVKIKISFYFLYTTALTYCINGKFIVKFRSIHTHHISLKAYIFH